MDIRRARLLKIIKEAWLPNIEVSGTQKLRFVDQLIAKGVTVQTEPKTNADRIRAMSDEELAEFLNRVKEPCDCCQLAVVEGACTETLCDDAMMKWLKQPAEEESV